MEGTFDTTRAIAAQEEYCKAHQVPRFAPYSGLCYMCGRNIYSPETGRDGALRGVTVEYARANLITSCPHCHCSFVE